MLQHAMWCLVDQSCPAFFDPMDCSPPDSFVHGDSPGKNTGVGLPFPPPGDLPNPGMEPRFPALQVDSLLSETPGKIVTLGIRILICDFWKDTNIQSMMIITNVMVLMMLMMIIDNVHATQLIYHV